MNSLTPDKSGTLYICATPIGNLKDCSFRLIETLQEVDIIAAEDTRVTRKLLHHYNVKKPLTSLQRYNEQAKSQAIIQWLESGSNVALVSDAGTPNISDPGAELVKCVLEKKLKVCPIPGPSSITAALSVCGMDASRFTFLGFFPKKEAEFIDLAESFFQTEIPLVFFETSKRLIKTLERIDAHYPNSLIFLSKELTKLFESHYFGTPVNVSKQIEESALKGEWCCVLKPSRRVMDVTRDVRALKALNMDRTQFQYICQTYLNISKNESYRLYHDE